MATVTAASVVKDEETLAGRRASQGRRVLPVRGLLCSLAFFLFRREFQRLLRAVPRARARPAYTAPARPVGACADALARAHPVCAHGREQSRKGATTASSKQQPPFWRTRRGEPEVSATPVVAFAPANPATPTPVIAFAPAHHSSAVDPSYSAEACAIV